MQTAVLHQLSHLIAAEGLDALSDRQLLEWFVHGKDEAAFALVQRRHGAMVLHVAQRVLSDRQAAEDVFQATFLVLARKAAAVAWKDSVAGWLHEVAHRLA